jgi:hypothetical protein
VDRTRFLHVHGVDPEKWAKRHGIEPFKGPCGGCGMILSTTVPFAYRHMRGLLAPKCECGYEGTPYCVVGFMT